MSPGGVIRGAPLDRRCRAFAEHRRSEARSRRDHATGVARTRAYVVMSEQPRLVLPGSVQDDRTLWADQLPAPDPKRSRDAELVLLAVRHA